MYNNNYYIDVAQGKIPGHEFAFMQGTKTKQQTPFLFENIWDFGSMYIYLEEDTLLYLSSSSSLDVGQLFIVNGLDENYDRVTRTVASDGQNPVALDGDLFRVFSVLQVGGSLHVGDIYVAESGSLTSGVPDDIDKIKGFILAGDGLSHQFMYTVPAGYTLNVIEQVFSVSKNDDQVIQLRVRFFPNDFFVVVSPISLYQASGNIQLDIPFSVPEKTDLDGLVYSTNIFKQPLTLNFAGVLIKNDIGGQVLYDDIDINAMTATTIVPENPERTHLEIYNTSKSFDARIRLYEASQDNLKRGIYLSGTDKGNNSVWRMPDNAIYTGEISAISVDSAIKLAVIEY